MDSGWVKRELARRAHPRKCRTRKDCDARRDQVRVLLEYLLLAPYLSLVRKKQLSTLLPIPESPPAPPSNFEVWFIRHAYSCNNNVPKNPLGFLAHHKYDPGLTTQGILDGARFDTRNLRLDRFRALNVCVSTSIRTWQTAALVFGRTHPLKLIVVPGLTEEHAFDLSVGNIPSPLQTQRDVMADFLRGLARYGIAVQTITVHAYNSTIEFMRFDPVPGKALDAPGQVTAEVATFYQAPPPTPLTTFHDPKVHGATWDRSFSKFDKSGLGALHRLLQGAHLGNDGTFFCVSHSHNMQRILSTLVDPRARKALAPVKVTPKEVEQFGGIEGLATLPPETPQHVIRRQNMWQMKCAGTATPLDAAVQTITIYQGFDRYKPSQALDQNRECDRDAGALLGLIRRFTRRGG
jgi:hypothetical protein